MTCTGIREIDRMRDATTTWKTAIIHVQVLGFSLMLIPLASVVFCFERIQTNMLQVSGQHIHRMSDIIYIQYSSIDTGPLIQPNVVQCLLCGRLENDKRVYKQHFIRNHCTYGYHRQCKQCGQHFSDKIDLAHHNEDKNACPGQPLVYSRKTGDLYYRGSNASVMLSFPVYPRLCDNHLIGHGNYDIYCVDVPSSTVGRDFRLTELPLGSLNANTYSVRDYKPVDPPVPMGATVVAVHEPPGDRTVLEHIYKLYTSEGDGQRTRTNPFNRAGAVLSDVGVIEVNQNMQPVGINVGSSVNAHTRKGQNERVLKRKNPFHENGMCFCVFCVFYTFSTCIQRFLLHLCDVVFMYMSSQPHDMCIIVPNA